MDYNICLECGHEWSEDNAYLCPHCFCGDFDTWKENEIEEV